MKCLHSAVEGATRFSMEMAAPVWHQLVIFPHAGGTVEFYRVWRNYLPPGVDLIVVQYPPPAPAEQASLWSQPSTAIDRCRRALSCLLGLAPISFFGHSMGALLALHVAAAMTSSRFRLAQLILSSQQVPAAIEALLGTEDDLISFAKLALFTDMGGQATSYPDEVRKYITSAIRRDLRLLQQLATQPTPKVHGTRVFGGKNDPLVSVEQLSAWGRQLEPPSDPELFAGGHFYHGDHMDAVLEAILLPVSQHACAGPSG